MKTFELLQMLERLETALNEIKYELNASVYMVEDDEFETVFFVRDQLYILRKLIEINNVNR